MFPSFKNTTNFFKVDLKNKQILALNTNSRYESACVFRIAHKKKIKKKNENYYQHSKIPPPLNVEIKKTEENNHPLRKKEKKVEI